MNKPISFYLPDDLVNRLDAVAAEDDRSRSSVVRKIVERHLREHAAMAGQVPHVQTDRTKAISVIGGAVEAHLGHYSRLSRKVIRKGFPMTERE